MHEKLNKVRQQNPNFDRELVNKFAETMPKLLSILINGCLYDNHIGSRDTALLAEPYIKNNEGEHIGFYFDYDTVINYIKTQIDLNETDIYPADIWTWSNVKFGDMQHLTNDEKLIINYALAELMDNDFPFYPASQRAYFWVKKNIENQEKRI